MKTVVVTGATSMIGVALIESLVAHKVPKIYAVVREGCQKLDRLPKSQNIEVVFCSADNYASLSEKIHEKCDVFYHIAWSLTGANRNRDLKEQSKNIIYTLDAVNTAKLLGCEKFVGAGSQAEYGRLDIERISPDSPVNPVQAYGVAKYAAGKMALSECEVLGLSCLWVRIFSVYGIYDKPSSMIACSLIKLIKGERAEFTPAEQRWDYLFSSDAGEAFYLIGEKSEGRKVYCLGSGSARPLKEYIEIMAEVTHSQELIDIGAVEYPKGVLMHLCADITTLREDTGFEPKVSFIEGVTATAKWLKKTER